MTPLRCLRRTFRGDRFHHLHSRAIEDASLSTISGLFNRTTTAADLPLSSFVAAGVTVCGDDCEVIGSEGAELSDSFSIAWEVRRERAFFFSCRCALARERLCPVC